jgi:sialate O-acetylesterase
LYLLPFELEFTFVYTEGNPKTALADQRLAQTAALQLPDVGMATAIDLGDLGSSFGNIHPRDKQTVGERLSLAARDLYYGNPVQYLGPTYSSYRVVQGTTYYIESLTL